ncbi:MAG: DUF6754 domain-containing protein, partial [Candidatus Zixiibacteriota bacterium]
MNKTVYTTIILLVLVFSAAAQSGPDAATGVSTPRPATNLTAIDTDNDHGHSITLRWTPSEDDGAGTESVIGYRIMYSAVSTDGPFKDVGVVPTGSVTFKHSSSIEPVDVSFIPDNTDLYYRVDALTGDTLIIASSEIVGPVQSRGQWFNKGLYPVLWAVIIFTILTVLFVQAAKKGKNLYVRPLAGIEAVDDAIGRATEMGRPILYVFGLGTASDIATIASFTILSRVAKRVAEYQTSLIVPNYDPIVMAVAQEIVKSAYLDAGRPNDYKEDSVFFITQAQFAFVGAVNGLMLRERPATNIYMGKFYAESLMLAETGVVSGSIQIAGTDEIAQIPFFVVACDYTLIGE